jgi:metal-responsive CopG/Arc/MetJ family transcriptional regulator
MRTVRITLDDDLVAAVDEVAGKLQTTRSAFAREAMRAAIRRFHESQLEHRHRRGYEFHPSQKSEFAVWENEQTWDEE